MKTFSLLVVVLYICILSAAADLSKAHPAKKIAVCARCIEAHEDYLASDALGGRGSATHDELVAAEYIASELEQYGVQPAAGENGDPSAGRVGEYIQRVELRNAASLIGPKRV